MAGLRVRGKVVGMHLAAFDRDVPAEISMAIGITPNTPL